MNGKTLPSTKRTANLRFMPAKSSINNSREWRQGLKEIIRNITSELCIDGEIAKESIKLARLLNMKMLFSYNRINIAAAIISISADNYKDDNKVSKLLKKELQISDCALYERIRRVKEAM